MSTQELPNNERTCATQQESAITLFIGGLGQSTTKETLSAYFSKYGPVSKVNLIIDWVTGKSKRCAIIFCEDIATVDKIMSVKSHTIEGKKVRVDRADSKKKGTKIVKTSKIFVGQVHPSLSQIDLEQYFSSFGEVKHMRLIKNNLIPFSSAQNGYLEFFDQKDAQKLLNSRHEVMVKGFKLLCQPFRANNSQEGEYLNMLSNIGGGGEKLDQYLQIYFSLHMGMNSLEGFDSDQDEEEAKDSGAGYDMNLMPSIAYMM